MGLSPQQIARLTALRDAAQAAHAAMGQAHWAMLSAAAQARAVLTETQRGGAQGWADSMQAWTDRHRAMMHPPMAH